MYTRRGALIYHIGLLISFFIWISQTVDARTYKVKDSTEQASEEEPIPFSAEFPFFAEEHPKESEENFGFSKEFNPDFIPYSESRNVTRYINPAETYHSVKDMPGRGRDHSRSYKGDDGYRKEEPSYRKDYRKDGYRPKDDSYGRDEPFRRQESHKKGGDNYRKGETYRKGDAYRKDGGYRKSDSYRNEETFRKEEPRHRSGGSRDYHKEQSGHRKHESYRRDNHRPSYRKEESSYHKQLPSYRKDDSGYSREHRENGSYRKKPIQNLYDDWSPEEDKSISREREDTTEQESEQDEYEEGDYPEREEEPPHSYKDTGPRKAVSTSMRPGPPYYTPNFKKPGDGKGHSSGNQARYDHSPTPTPQAFYAPQAPTKSHEQSKQFQHRKGQPVAAKSSLFDKEWSEFRPSPPDPIQQNSHTRSREEYPESDYSNPATKKAVAATTPMPALRQNCVKLKKMENPPNANGKYVKNMMTCYVCVDEKTGSNYEQCSYESDSKTKPYTHTTGEEEASHTSISHRQKRDASSNDRTKREKDYYDTGKGKPSYKYDSDSFDEKDDILDSSDKDEDEGSVADYDSDDDNCYRKRKGNMSCIVCQSANKQGSYEQCSYQSDPEKNKYQHSVEKVYGSSRLPESDSKYKKEPRYSASNDYDSSPEIPSKHDYSSSEFEPPPTGQEKSKSSKNPFSGGSFGFGLDSFEFSDLGSDFKGDKSSKSSFDFGDSFDFDSIDSIPEPAENEGRFSSRDDTFNFKSDDMTDIDMSKDIGGFDKKNRSDCKKVIKNKMTCYQCGGGKGAKEEECMYVAAAEPKKKHLSFSQVQEYSSDPLNTTDVNIDYSPFSFGKRKYKKYHPDLADIKFFNKLKEKATMEASRWPRATDASNSTEIDSKKKHTIKDDRDDQDDQDEAASNREYKHGEEDDEDLKEDEESEEEEESEDESEVNENDDYNAVPTEPPEIDYKEAEKGEFHTETEPAWDPKLGISLPRYMLQKSEHEAVFDEVLASG